MGRSNDKVLFSLESRSTHATHSEAPIHISNVQVVDPETKKPTRVGHRVEEQVKDGVKRTVRVRYAKKSGKDL